MSAIAPAAAVVATWRTSEPVAEPVISAIMIAALAATCVWAARRAPWWSLLVMAGLSLVFVTEPLMVVVAATALVASVVDRLRPHAVLRALSAVLSVTALARLDVDPFLGSRTIVALVGGGLVTITGVTRMSGRVRRAFVVTTAVLTAAAGVIAALFVWAAAGVRADVQEANRSVSRAIAALRDGEFTAASDLFAGASSSYRDAERRIDRPWMAGSRLVPVVSQNDEVAEDVLGALVGASRELSESARHVDVEALRLRDGRIDVSAIEELEMPLREISSSLDRLGAALRGDESPWVVDPVRRRLLTVNDDVQRLQATADTAMSTVRLAPDLLGRSGLRRYFVAFTTPAEARGLGGFMGNYAVFTFDRGVVELEKFGRSDGLVSATPAEGISIALDDELVQRYGPFGFRDPATGLVAPNAWKNVTMPPDFPTVASLIRRMYGPTGGHDVDGVLLLDAYAVAELLRYTGPLDVPGVPYRLNRRNAADYIVRDQYRITDRPERVDVLEVIARSTTERVLAGALPAPHLLARDLAPFASEGRVMMWAAAPEENALLEDLGLAGGFPPPGAGSFAFSFNNAGGNKIDPYLERTATVSSVAESPTARPVVRVQLELTNTAPPSGLPDYVMGDGSTRPQGTNYMYLSAYASLELLGAVRDGAPLAVEAGRELARNVFSAYIELAPGASTTLQFDFDASRGVPSELSVFLPPLADRPRS